MPPVKVDTYQSQGRLRSLIQAPGLPCRPTQSHLHQSHLQLIVPNTTNPPRALNPNPINTSPDETIFSYNPSHPNSGTYPSITTYCTLTAGFFRSVIKPKAYQTLLLNSDPPATLMPESSYDGPVRPAPSVDSQQPLSLRSPHLRWGPYHNFPPKGWNYNLSCPTQQIHPGHYVPSTHLLVQRFSYNPSHPKSNFQPYIPTYCTLTIGFFHFLSKPKTYQTLLLNSDSLTLSYPIPPVTVQSCTAPSVASQQSLSLKSPHLRWGPYHNFPPNGWNYNLSVPNTTNPTRALRPINTSLGETKRGFL